LKECAESPDANEQIRFIPIIASHYWI
jgi:hypothetical protein